jgi:hypothetical protein
MMQIRFREREDTVIFVKLQRFNIRLHLVGVEIRHKYTANAFLGFWWRDYILALYTLE